MMRSVEVPLWLLILILAFAAVTLASHFLLPSVRWFFRRRMERVVAELNKRLDRPIQPFKLARRHDMIQRLMFDPEVLRAVRDHARESGMPEEVAQQQARVYAREIVPSFSATAYFGFAIRLARMLSRALYRVRLGRYDAESLGSVDPEATVVFVMNHRSNMDYVLVTYLAAERSALSYAVGEWARVWPLSRLIRAMGAYFIRRSSRDALYRRVLARYVRLATDAGVTQAVFPEGGLSLTGGLAPPRLGILKYLVDGFDASLRDVVFIPVALNYDRVVEDRILIAAGTRGERRFRARISVVARFVAKQLWQRMRGRYHRFGHAAVGFGAPLSLGQWQRDTGGEIEDLAEELMRRIGAVVPVLPVPLVALAMLEAGGPTDRAALEARVGALLNRIGPRAGDLAGVLAGEGRQEGAAWALRSGLRMLRGRGILETRDGVIHVAPGQEEILVFYAASIRHLLPEPAQNAAAAKS